jgi:hypothetical protein
MNIELKENIKHFMDFIYDYSSEDDFICVEYYTDNLKEIKDEERKYKEYLFFIEKYNEIEWSPLTSKYRIHSLKSDKFQNSKFFKIILTIDIDKNNFVHFIDIFNDTSNNGISFIFNKVKFNSYIIDNLLIIENKDKISFDEFNDSSRIILQNLGLINGYMPQEKAFYFSFDNFNDTKFNGFCYSEEFAKSYKSHFKIIARSNDKNRAYISTNTFANLCENSLNEDMSRAIHLLMEANRASVEMQGIGYAVVLETLANIIVKKDEKKIAPLLEKEKAKKFRSELHLIGKEFFEIDYNDKHIIKNKIDNMLNQKSSNSTRLLTLFIQLDIPITSKDKRLIEYRNNLLHGRSVTNFSLSEMDNYLTDIVKVNNRLNFLITALILKYAEHKKHIIEVVEGDEYYRYSSISNTN